MTRSGALCFVSVAFLALGWGWFLSVINWSVWWLVGVVAAIVAADLGCQRLPSLRRPLGAQRRWALPWTTPAAIMFGFWAFFDAEFRLPAYTGIWYHLRFGLQGAGVSDYVGPAVNYTLATMALVLATGHLVARERHFRIADRVFAIPLVLITPFLGPAVQAANPFAEAPPPLAPHIENLRGTSPLPDTAPNLILLYLESAEATNEQLDLPSPVYEDLTALGREGLRIDGIGQAAATGFTMGGLVASQCGVPLLSLGLNNTHRYSTQHLVPGAYCLGDVLGDAGYKVEYYGGATHVFAGKGTFLRGHGFQVVKGRDEFSKEFGPEAMNPWGLDDDHLYQVVLDRLRTLHDSGERYAVAMLTLAAHRPDGYPTPRCRKELGPRRNDDPRLFGIRCTGYLARDFVRRLRDGGLLEDTLLVVLSDHFAGNRAIAAQADQLDRRDYFVALGERVTPGTMQVEGTMLDVYPTILELLGARLPDGRAGLGVSLLDDAETLRQALGKEELDRAIMQDMEYRTTLWTLPDGS